MTFLLLFLKMKSMLFASLLGCAWLTFASPGPLVGSEAAYGDAVANDGPAVVGEKRALLDDEDAFGGDAVIEEPEPQSIAERAAPPRVRAVSFLDKVRVILSATLPVASGRNPDIPRLTRSSSTTAPPQTS